MLAQLHGVIGGLEPISIPSPRIITGKQLKEINAESIRLGFSHNLWPKKIGRNIPDDLNIPILQAFVHTSATDRPPKRNIRLLFSLPRTLPKNWRSNVRKWAREANLVQVTLDITPDTWAVIKNQDGSNIAQIS